MQTYEAKNSNFLYLKLAPKDVAMFKFLLEAHENAAYFTVLDRHECLLKIIFSPDYTQGIKKILAQIGQSIAIEHININRTNFYNIQSQI